jgi:hypothetical protein
MYEDVYFDFDPALDLDSVHAERDRGQDDSVSMNS